MAKMQLDFTESQRVIAPEGEYSLRLKEKVKKPSRASGKLMFELSWMPFDPPDGVSQESLDKCIIKDWISLAPNALFSLKNLMWASGVECECAGCNNKYSAKLDACDRCQSAVFSVDDDFIGATEVRAFIIVKKDQAGENDVNEIKKYLPMI